MTTGDDLPLVDPDERAPTADARIDGVLLAAGTSDRYGRANKLLEPVAGELVVKWAVRALLETPLESVTAVVGHEGARVRSALESLPVETVPNDAYERGQSTSVRTGVEAASERADAVVIALGDLPAVSPESVRMLVRAYCAGDWTALAAAYEGVRGNPVLFDRTHFDRLTDLAGDRGGREILLEAERAALVETADPGVLVDVDRPSALERVRALLEDGSLEDGVLADETLENESHDVRGGREPPDGS